MKIEVHCDKHVERLVGKRIRVRLPEYDGHGIVDSIQGDQDGGIATLILEENDD